MGRVVPTIIEPYKMSPEPIVINEIIYRPYKNGLILIPNYQVISPLPSWSL